MFTDGKQKWGCTAGTTMWASKCYLVDTIFLTLVRDTATLTQWNNHLPPPPFPQHVWHLPRLGFNLPPALTGREVTSKWNWLYSSLLAGNTHHPSRVSGRLHGWEGQGCRFVCLPLAPPSHLPHFGLNDMAPGIWLGRQGVFSCTCDCSG